MKASGQPAGAAGRSSKVASLGALVSRREVLGGAVSAAALGALPSGRAWAGAGRFGFREIARGVDGTHHVAPGYRAQVLLRWGDPVVPAAPAFDPLRQSPAAQERQFGYNNDFVGFVGLPFGSADTPRGLLCVNHEFTSAQVMFADPRRMASERTDIEMSAHGGSIVEIAKGRGGWRPVADSPFNRRLSARTSAIALSGPAAGHPRLGTAADPDARSVRGTLANCAGGMTPWGTWLMAEEHFSDYFRGSLDGHPEAANYRRYGVPGGRYAWSRGHPRFDINAEPNEANRFGWVVEVDPLDPAAKAKKRTALGRLKHEGAECVVNGDGRLVVYQGDDGAFEYLYRFVTAGRYDPSERAANRDLLDEGRLDVARFAADGGLDWLPLVQGRGPLTAENGFASQADVAIEARRAADLLGATPLDRPEDVQPNPLTGKVYVLLTHNAGRAPWQTDAANPRAGNLFGHILELSPPDGDHAARRYRWDILVRCGDPAAAAVGADWNPATTADGWFASPDNCAVDPQGRLWVASDQGNAWPLTGGADGLWALETEGPLRGTGRLFFRAPVGAEVTGPRFTPDGRALFLALQHPGVAGAEHYPGFARRSTFADPATRWPDFQAGMPPRPAVVAITREDGGLIGGRSGG